MLEEFAARKLAVEKSTAAPCARGILDRDLQHGREPGLDPSRKTSEILLKTSEKRNPCTHQAASCWKETQACLDLYRLEMNFLKCGIERVRSRSSGHLEGEKQMLQSLVVFKQCFLEPQGVHWASEAARGVGGTAPPDNGESIPPQSISPPELPQGLSVTDAEET